MKALIVILFPLLIVGCATNSRWQHSWKGQEEFNRDYAYCQQRASGADAGMLGDGGYNIGYGGASGSGAMAALGLVQIMFGATFQEGAVNRCLGEMGYARMQ